MCLPAQKKQKEIVLISDNLTLQRCKNDGELEKFITQTQKLYNSDIKMQRSPGRPEWYKNHINTLY